MQALKPVGHESPLVSQSGDQGPTVHVIATTIEATREALAAACALARGLSGRVTVFFCRRSSGYGSADTEDARAEAELRCLAKSSMPTPSVLSCVCDRPTDVTQMFLPPGLVVIGGVARHWWPTTEERLARALAQLGCHVTFVHVPAAPFVPPLMAAARHDMLRAREDSEHVGEKIPSSQLTSQHH
jgi:hypothetical protein